MGDLVPGEAGNQAVQQPVIDEPNEDVVYPARLAQQQAVMLAQPTVQQIAEANYPVPPSEKFSFKPDECFERFRKANGLDQKDGESQVNTLIYSMGEEADDIIGTYGVTAE